MAMLMMMAVYIIIFAITYYKPFFVVDFEYWFFS